MIAHNWSPTDVVLIITSISGGICSIIAALRATKASEKADQVANNQIVNSQKLDEVHTLANGNLTKAQEELEMVKRQKEFLDKLVIELTSNSPVGLLEDARKRVETKLAEVGKRRRSDVSRSDDISSSNN